MVDYQPSYRPVAEGPLARRPAAADFGRGLWVDENDVIWRSNGTAWSLLGSSSYAPISLPRPQATVVLWGDSITQHNGPVTTGVTVDWQGEGWWFWAMQDLGFPIALANNAGVIGDTSAQVLARFAAGVSAYHPGYVVINAGTNNADTGSAAAQAAVLEADLGAMLDLVRGIGAIAILTTIIPNNTHSATKRAAMNLVNQWIKRQGQNYSRPGIIVVDWAPAVQDSSGNLNVSNVALTACSTDGVHPVTLGARRMGKVLADALRTRVPSLNMLVANEDEAGAIMTNPLLFGTAGTVSSPVTGQAPTGWTTGVASGSSVTGTAELVTRTDAYPNLQWAELNCTSQGTGGTGGIQFYQYSTSPAATGWSPGDGFLYQASCEFQTDAWSAATQGLFLLLQFQDSGFATVARARGLVTQSDTPPGSQQLYPLENQLLAGQLWTPPIAPPANAKYMQIQFNLYALGKARMSRASVHRVLLPTDT